jgi:hypothetical protein
MKLIFEKSVKGRDGYSLPQDLFDEMVIRCLKIYLTILKLKNVYPNMLLVKIKNYLVKSLK